LWTVERQVLLKISDFLSLLLVVLIVASSQYDRSYI
jgi:hypothetical protein